MRTLLCLCACQLYQLSLLVSDYVKQILFPDLFVKTLIPCPGIESLEHAMKRGAPIIAEYLGGAVNCDAYHMTDPRADGLGVSSCIERSLEDAGVSPEEVVRASFHKIFIIVLLSFSLYVLLAIVDFCN